MIISLLLYGAGIFLSLSPAAERKHHLPVVHIWALICLLTIVLYILLTTEITQASDYARYQSHYNVLRSSSAGVGFESGFVIFARFFSAIGVPFRVFLSVTAAVVLSSVYYCINCLFRKEDVALISLIYLNYFALYNIIFNTLRSGIATALVLMAVIACLRRNRWVISLCLISISVTFHLSGAFAFPVLVTRVRALKVWHCVAVVILIFAASYIGINAIVFGRLFAVSDVFADNLVYYQDSEELMQRYASRNRIDFLAFSIIPFVMYGLNELLMFLGKFKKAESVLPTYILMLKSYALLLISFSAFAYMPYSDRFAQQAWLLWPVVVMWPTLYMFNNVISDTWILRAGLAISFILIPNLIGYQDTLFTVSSAVEKALI